MSAVASKRSVMTLYTSPSEIESHRSRIVLAEKGIQVDVIELGKDDHSEDLSVINPYHSLPTLVDRNIVLYHSNIIMEYLDERFPHPPLLPVYPVARAQSRLMMYRIERDWYSLVRAIEGDDAALAKKAKDELFESLMSVVPVFQNTAYFLSDEYSLVDCAFAPILWRLPAYEIELPARAKALLAYAKRLFDRETFQQSLTDTEKELRNPL
ncbi:MAG: glutathione S-transferase N-terminal domain-containing protein [Pseudomonadota bacterium]|nr:glutathione S-transferase N-terminal domain-containing protein [Gammaproteobacteria bacterium]MBU1628829.1 glutathione S-transferase N-terminal domain-containing protein [Gammaproteobacteria bacterium]MBU1926460.1 glutathione S-transferase N-terminal domain-containing protein [Gammaproteobacteria bacterium]MBU2545655.1 glutathione S-transferase N-terminal domain-containing protein [Gammaproteobacteria bacterium]